MIGESVKSVDDGVSTAVKHALGWLVMGNGVGLYLALLLLKPEWQLGQWTYGRWVPVHLNVQLYGWTALPLVAWLFSMYEVGRSKAAAWAPAAVWAWTAALAMGALHWLDGTTGGKIFLDWKDGALWAFVLALVMLWLVLTVAWKERAVGWSLLKRRVSLGGLIGLALVPAAIIVTASPKTYPPVDRMTGGPTGSSLLGSSLIVVGLMLLLPRVVAETGNGKAGRGTWSYFIFCWVFFGIAEAVGGTHFDWWQNVSLLFMPPWAWLLARDWAGFSWPQGSGVWRTAMFGWWAVLVLTGYLMYFPWILDRIKFTQGLVAHSHLAMAGFTTSFCALLAVLLTGRRIGGPISIFLWNVAVVVMLMTLATMGWKEGAGPSWMLENPVWREVGLILRAACGAVMLPVSAVWLYQWKNR
jgi:cytochrome c oxidase cbb3-type subunit I